MNPMQPNPGQTNKVVNGYRGIWFTLGQFSSEYGDKYSGGLGTYTADHIPLAIYCRKVDKTFFVARPGYKYVSIEPYSVAAFRQIVEQEMTYPQPWYIANKGFLHLFTRYTAGRELYWETSLDGSTWGEPQKLAGFGGHYQVSKEQDGRVITAFNWHPDGDVDRRTNLYYAETRDMGQSWTTGGGKTLQTPLSSPETEAMVVDYASRNKLVYIHDIVFDRYGNPVILYTASDGHDPGPQNGPRLWRVTHWTGDRWQTHDITTSDHNYDMGSLYIEGDIWRLIGPTEIGPQPHHTGGEMAVWISEDSGQSWKMLRQITHSSEYNHSYARAPLYAKDPFYVFWADGDPRALSESRNPRIQG